MASSLDGRTSPERWTPDHAHSHAMYEQLHTRLGGGSWLVGRVTGAEMAKGDAYPEYTGSPIRRENWLPRREADAFGIVTDAKGKIVWGRADVGGDPLIVVLSESVSDAHLAGLRVDGVGYVFAGSDTVDLELALTILRRELSIETLLLEGGGTLNGAFLRAGLIDEISLMIEPAVDGMPGAPCVFDASDGESLPRAPVARIRLRSHELLAGGAIWLRYDVEN
jgi:riboflavin biosynthesis pyrimidine reductase